MSTIKERSLETVSLHGFSNAGVPEKICHLDLHCYKDRQYILRMIVRAEGGKYQIPAELRWIRPMFNVALARQVVLLGIDHPFCYITVRRGLVDSQTDDEWHVDGFSTRTPHVPEQNYIWCSESGTEYSPTEVSFPDDFDPMIHNVNTYLQKFIDPARVRSCEVKTVYCLDPYLLHRRPACTSGTVRTFVRISFVPIEINDINNTQNPLLPREYTRDGVSHRNTLIAYGGNS